SPVHVGASRCFFAYPLAGLDAAQDMEQQERGQADAHHFEEQDDDNEPDPEGHAASKPACLTGVRALCETAATSEYRLRLRVPHTSYGVHTGEVRCKSGAVPQL